MTPSGASSGALGRVHKGEARPRPAPGPSSSPSQATNLFLLPQPQSHTAFLRARVTAFLRARIQGFTSTGIVTTSTARSSLGSGC